MSENVSQNVEMAQRAQELLISEMEILYDASRLAAKSIDDHVKLASTMNAIAQTIAWGHETNMMMNRKMEWSIKTKEETQ